jgi:hypothetical protein
MTEGGTVGGWGWWLRVDVRYWVKRTKVGSKPKTEERPGIVAIDQCLGDGACCSASSVGSFGQ